MTVAAIVSHTFLHSDSNETLSLISFLRVPFFVSIALSLALWNLILPHDMDVVQGGQHTVYLCGSPYDILNNNHDIISQTFLWGGSYNLSQI